MILGIGTDMADIPRMKKTLERFGIRFLERCFAEEEYEPIEQTQDMDGDIRAAKYAKRWAAKEAYAKALGFGIREDVMLKDILVLNDKYGKPEIILRGGAKERLTALTPQGMTPRVHLSLSDEPPLALAFVVISAEPL